MRRPVSSSDEQDGDDDAKQGDGQSLGSLAAEAAASADSNDTELLREERARKALECDCVAELRDGPCGSQFSEAFYCFLTSTADEQGSDCVKPFVAMQTCMAANPDAFTQYTGDDGNKENPEGEYQKDDKKGKGASPTSPPKGAMRKPVE